MGSIVVEDISCKNICNGISLGYYLTASGTSFGRTASDTGLVIEVKENTDYTISTTVTQERYRIAFTNTLLDVGGSSTDTYNALTKDGTKESITRNSGAYKYLIINATDLTKIQAEEGKVASGFVEHKEFTNKEVYSTNEQEIGTWIDGKPLYRKVIKSTIPTTSTDGTLADSYVSISSNIETVFVEYGFIPLSSGVTNVLPFTNSNNYRTTVSISDSKTLRIMNWIASNSGEQIIVSVMYTKTTDNT